jgi:hypothetical protein
LLAHNNVSQAFEEYQRQLNVLLVRKMEIIRKFQEALGGALGV